MKRTIAFILSLFMTLSLVGCGSTYKSESDYVESGPSASINDSYGGFDYNEAIEEEIVESPDSAPKNPTTTTEQPTQAESPEIKKQDKLVYTCNISIETLEYQDTIKEIKDKIAQFNGVVEYEEEYDDSYDWYYSDYEKTSGTLHMSMTIRVPSANYEEFLNSIEGTGKVLRKSTNVENISKTYYETEAVIESLKIQEERLLGMLESAETIEDMIAVEERLTEVQTELNRYKTNLSNMDMDVAYSTINLDVDEVLEYSVSTQPEKTNTFKDRLQNTIKRSWTGLLSILEDLLFMLITALPVLLVFGAVILVILIPILRHNKKKKAKKNPPPKPVIPEDNDKKD